MYDWCYDTVEFVSSSDSQLGSWEAIGYSPSLAEAGWYARRHHSPSRRPWRRLRATLTPCEAEMNGRCGAVIGDRGRRKKQQRESQAQDRGGGHCRTNSRVCVSSAERWPCVHTLQDPCNTLRRRLSIHDCVEVLLEIRSWMQQNMLRGGDSTNHVYVLVARSARPLAQDYYTKDLLGKHSRGRHP